MLKGPDYFGYWPLFGFIDMDEENKLELSNYVSSINFYLLYYPTYQLCILCIGVPQKYFVHKPHARH